MLNYSNQRDYFRVYYTRNLSATIKEIELDGVTFKTDGIITCINDMSVSGMFIKTDMTIPVREGIMLLVEFIIIGEKFVLPSYVVRSKDLTYDGLNGYGVKFDISNSERNILIQKINEFNLRLSSSKIDYRDCSVCDIGKCKKCKVGRKFK